MALNKQVHIYGIATDAFYNDEEIKIYSQLQKYRREKHALKRIYDDGYIDDSEYKHIANVLNITIKVIKDRFKELLLSNEKVRDLDSNHINDKNVISIFESTLTRVLGMKTNELSLSVMVVESFYFEILEQIIKNGFYYNGEKYRYYSSSAGQIRTKKAVFIKDSLWSKYRKILMCGLTIDRINDLGGINVNKYLAYLALTNSATELWEGFDIDKCIVVNDFETSIDGEVDYIDDVTYKIKRQKMNVPVEHTDGCGMILPSVSKKNFMVRLPWVKGLLSSFDYLKFIKEHNCSSIVKDIYGREWDIIKDDIQVIFTKSQFKMHRFYQSWDEYKSFFKQYNCQAGICNMEKDYIDDSCVSYQMLQTLTDYTEDELKAITEESRIKINNIASDKEVMLDVFGVKKEKRYKTYLQQALEIYPEILQDVYCRRTLNDIKRSMVKRYRSGKIDIESKYTFILPDLYAFCEYLFLDIKKPKGLLVDGEVSCRLFDSGVKLDCLRSPHLMAEHAVRKNIVHKDMKKWFDTDGLYTSTHDLISKVLMFDNDGDTSLVVADSTFVKMAERNMENYDNVPLYYDMKNAHDVILDNNTIWEGLNNAFTGGNIGVYSNDISKIWNSGVFTSGSEKKQSEALNVIKLLCMENNFVIDFAKTLYQPERPKDINRIIKKYTNNKLPYFFRFAKDKTKNQVVDITKEEYIDTDTSIVNRLRKLFVNRRLKFTIENFGRFNYKNLMHNKDILVDMEVIEKFDELNTMYHFKINQKNKSNVNYIMKLVNDEIMTLGYDRSDIVDMLVAYQFKLTDSEHKNVLWSCFGDVIVENLRNNISEDSIQCRDCGNRFIPNYHNEKLCNKCATYQPIENKTIACIDCGKEVLVDARNMTKVRCDGCQKEHRKAWDRERKRKSKD